MNLMKPNGEILELEHYVLVGLDKEGVVHFQVAMTGATVAHTAAVSDAMLKIGVDGHARIAVQKALKHGSN